MRLVPSITSDTTKSSEWIDIVEKSVGYSIADLENLIRAAALESKNLELEAIKTVLEKKTKSTGKRVQSVYFRDIHGLDHIIANIKVIWSLIKQRV